MRISDWSSDVCSSDLSADGISTSARVKAIRSGQGAALTGDPTGQRSYAEPEFDRLWQEISDLDMTVTIHLGGRIPRFGEKQHFLPDMVMSKLAMAEPIAILILNGALGRASCRERVCQYVWISGGA